ncbi:MAG: chitobiase/beta-hexosaminidase C-terminal domain-containing protein [Prevotella sp.]|nr:chitobiase/beta-hexosaminidase C-terminal domain-containing protein [Prevotella sp.]
MKKFYTTLFALAMTMTAMAQGWPANYQGVMLQGFYWDSFDATRWTNLESQVDELSQYFSLVWIPQSGNCGHLSMGYDDYYWFDQNSSFGTEAELRSLISTFKAKGIGTIADVVVNHRNTNGWVTFPKETYNGVTYQLLPSDICANDDNGKTKTWADANGIQLSPNNDTGEGWDGMRDLDHKSANVQENVKAYLHYLLEDLGYTGFRYDMVKGFGATYLGLYNEDAAPQFSVGEYWDGNKSAVENWLNGTKKNSTIQSAAFDFPFRYTVRDAINNNNWGKLSNTSVMADAAYRRYAVTFVENHDTEKRSNADQDPIKRDTLAANAYLLAMPGTPCVFLKHWLDCKKDIAQMINVRQFAGIHNESEYSKFESATTHYAVRTKGAHCDLLCVVGDLTKYTPTNRWIKVAEGYHYSYFLPNDANTAWIDLPSGEYLSEQTATLTAVTNENAQIVYTTDGSTPTASSTKVSSGTKITIPIGTTTLTAGLLVGNTVSGIVSRSYNIIDFQPYDITIYVNTDQVGWSNVNFWTWGGDGSHSPNNKDWPGDKVSTTVEKDGKQWFTNTYTINSPTDVVNFVFSTGSGSPQTVDINNIREDTFFEISTETEGGKNKVNVVSTGIEELRMTNDDIRMDDAIYDLQGRRVTNPTHGIYIRGGKKFIVR